MKDASFSAVVRSTALELGVSKREVRDVVLEFLNQSGRYLIKNRTMHLMGLGRLKTVTRINAKLPTPHKGVARRGYVVVSFTKAERLREQTRLEVEEKVMEKFGVDENVNQDRLEKAASDGCPECGEKVERHGHVMKCPNCGTKPFESGEKKKK